MIEDVGDAALDYSGCSEDNVSEVTNGVNILIKEFLKRQEVIEALIVDGIANYDTYRIHKETRKVQCFDVDKHEEIETQYVHTSSTFDARKLVKHLTHINQDFMREFCVNYSISIVEGDNIYIKLKKLSNPKLYKYIEKTLIEIRQTPQLLSCLI